MNPLSVDGITSWPEVIFYLGVLFAVLFLIAIGIAAIMETRKTRLVAKQEEDLRQLVARYEQLAEKTLDAQQRTATEVSELRARAASIEQILRTVE
jgi:Tfp pilus assembly protein PilO